MSNEKVCCSRWNISDMQKKLIMSTENMRRMFYRWLTAARKARHRRRLLQEKEREMQVAKMAEFYDRWKEKYLDIRLQPLVSLSEFLRQVVAYRRMSRPTPLCCKVP